MKNYRSLARTIPLLSLSLCLTLLFPSNGQASSIAYATLEQTDDLSKTIVIQAGGLESKISYHCSIETYVCQTIDSASPPTLKPSPSGSIPANIYDALPESTRLLKRGYSQNGKFVFSVTYADEEIPSRTFTLVDTTSGKTFTKSTPVSLRDKFFEEARIFSVSPDSKTLAYLDDEAGTPMVTLVDLQNQTGKTIKGAILSKKQYTVADFLMIDHRTLLFIANRENPLTWSLFSYDTKTKAVTTIMRHVSYGERLTMVGGKVVFLRVTGASVQPTVYNPKNRGTRDLPIPFDNKLSHEIPRGSVSQYGDSYGALSTPAKTSLKVSHPLILWLHGGPYRQTSAGIHPYQSYGVYDWVLEEARKNGAIVLKLDYSGSYGYGTAKANALKGKVGIRDVDDVTNALASIKRQLAGKYTIGEVHLVGNSYGGYLALKGITSKPSLFSGAFSLNGVTDWSTLLANLNDSIFNQLFEGIPGEENDHLYDNADILYHLGGLSAKHTITIVQATEDSTIDPKQADLLADALTTKGKPFTLIKIPKEDHVFSKASSITTICTSLLASLHLTPNSADRCHFEK